ncbi:MAG: YlbF family regulator, partial [Gemmatimonadota bacterium]
KRAGQAVDEDRELVELRNQLKALEERIEAQLRAGQQPGEEVAKNYEELAGELQGKPAFQRLVAAQSNFDKIMYKVNETMAKGLQEGAQSKIILSS